MNRTTIQVGSYGVNCSILDVSGAGWIIDPGQDAESILAVLREKLLSPAGILLTHAHFDHIGGIPALQVAYPDLPVYVHAADIPALTHPMNQCPPDYPPIPVPRHVIPLNDATLPFLTVIETPGHTPGGVCYYFEKDNLLFSGDTLFAGSVGRTDFPGGDMATLVRSLERLSTLPPDTTVIPGHGMFTTIAHERKSNPFMGFGFKV